MAARVRALLGLAMCAVVALLLPSLGTAEPTRALVAAALLVVVLCATVAVSRGLSRLTPRPLPQQSRRADDDRCLRTGQATDPVHSPLRPRAPGLV